MRKNFWQAFGTMRVRILVIVALCWLLPTLVLGGYMSSIFVEALAEKTRQAVSAEAQHAQEQTVQEIERLLKKSRDVTYDEELYKGFLSYRQGYANFESYYSMSRSYWRRMFLRDKLLTFSAFFLIERPEQIVYNSELAETLVHFQRQVQPVLMEVGETLDTYSRFVVVDGELYHVRNLYGVTMERFGMMALRVDPERLFAPLLRNDTLWQAQVDVVVDGCLFSFTGNSFVPEEAALGFSEEQDNLYYTQSMRNGDFSLAYRIRLDKAQIYGQVNAYYRIILALVLLLLPIEALIMLYFHRRLTTPITQIASATQRLAGGELGITVPTQGMDEVGQLGTAFNTMSTRIQRLIDQSYREELALRDARIEALQSRINPHFLNNALELINWQARLEGDEGVSQMIEALSVLINAALDRFDQRMVSIAEEVQVAEAYFFFVRQRFGERATMEIQVEEQLRHVPVPRLITQTLLENAVEHGIGPAGGGGVRLSIYQAEGYLYIDVRNTGKRLTTEELSKIHALLSEDNQDIHSSHMGLRNVALRLQLIYEGRAGLSLTVDDHGDTLARVAIPEPEA